VDGLPPSLADADRRALLGLDPLAAHPKDAAVLHHALDGLVLLGSRLSVVVEEPEGFRLPPAPRGRRNRSPRDRANPWLPFLDEEGRYSLSPEPLARFHAGLFEETVVIDAFCGCGGDTVALLQAGHRVLAVEDDPQRLMLARRNVKALGLIDRVRFYGGDARTVVPRLLSGNQGAGLFLDPPWGGPGANARPVTAQELGLAALAPSILAARRCVLKAPRSFDPASLPARPWLPRPFLRSVRPGDPPIVAAVTLHAPPILPSPGAFSAP
jgi:hypothetical protein